MDISVILSTRNPSKITQIKAMCEGLAFSVLTLEQAGISGEAIENGKTLKENAIKKARYVHEQISRPVIAMADDSGLFINALGGEPGVRSARWAGRNVTTGDIMRYCLESMRGQEDRTAVFRTVVAVIMPQGTEYLFEGEVFGHLLAEPRVPSQPKMPYSGLFVPDGTDRCLAQMSVREENAISHRGQAFRKAFDFLASLAEEGSFE